VLFFYFPHQTPTPKINTSINVFTCKTMCRQNRLPPFAPLLILLLLTACQSDKRWLRAGEYTHGLHLSTRDDGTFYAWFEGDNTTNDTLNTAFLCVPFYPKANIALWQPPNQSPCFFGVLEHLGQDSFCIKMEKMPQNTAFANALTAPKGMVFTLQKERADWRNFYYWNDSENCFLYEKPDFNSIKHSVSAKTRLYSPELQGEWAKISVKDSVFWAHRSSVY
jgi:hypothetical protein